MTALRIVATVLTGAALLFWARVGSAMLSAGLSILLAALALFVSSAWLTALDTSVELWLSAHRSRSVLIELSTVYRFIGQPVYFAAAVLGCAVILARRARSVIPAAVLVGAVGVGVVVEEALKMTVGRSAEAVAGFQDPSKQLSPGAKLMFLHSFPSGHVTAFAVLLGLVAVGLVAGRSLAVRIQVSAVAAAAVGWVGFMAVYVRAHTLTDVIGGLLLGGAVVALGAAVLGRMLPADPVPRPATVRPARPSDPVPLPDESGRIPVG